MAQRYITNVEITFNSSICVNYKVDDLKSFNKLIEVLDKQRENIIKKQNLKDLEEFLRENGYTISDVYEKFK